MDLDWKDSERVADQNIASNGSRGGRARCRRGVSRSRESGRLELVHWETRDGEDVENGVPVAVEGAGQKMRSM